jgi:hypothetical protein
MLLRFKAAAAISAVLLAGGTAVTFAPTALAVDDQTLCVLDLQDQVQCAYLNVSSGFVDTSNNSSSPSGADYHWNINTSSSGYHQISSVAVTGCMDFTGGQIMLAGCDGTSYEEWKIVATSVIGQVELQNEAFPKDCLNDHYQIGQVNAAQCNEGGDELWATYAITAGG